ncbi:hypothetical protein [Chthonobacter rhizosphaerae]|uniref:hypothetical protein n=1 Tax=Chthonobacter rhizosphaerae TaxID=2735553 RepID=UPI0015EEFE44|nr:hypothetical protein [Chthonobacter rhizosphaerae]
MTVYAFAGRSATLLACLAALAPSVPAAAQGTAEPFRVELNRLEPVGADCRATVVTENTAAERLDSLKLDLVVFDRDGVVAKRLAAELGPLSARKTVVKAFPITGLACEAIDRVLVNDVVACATPAGALAGCVDRVEPTSRSTARFLK